MAKLDVVHRRSRTEFDIVEIDLATDVLWTYVSNGVLHYQTRDCVYQQISTLEESARQLERIGFEKVERGLVANMAHAVAYDAAEARLYFSRNLDVRLSLGVSKPFRAKIPAEITHARITRDVKCYLRPRIDHT